MKLSVILEASRLTLNVGEREVLKKLKELERQGHPSGFTIEHGQGRGPGGGQSSHGRRARAAGVSLASKGLVVASPREGHTTTANGYSYHVGGLHVALTDAGRAIEV
jgi:hypothetical protein